MRTDKLADMPLVQVQVVTYNSAMTLADCLDAVVAQSYSNIRILVVDNASSDGSEAVAQAYGERIHVLKLQENTGYAAAHNLGFREAVANGADFVLTLNPDAELDADYVSVAVSQMISRPECGGISGKLVRQGSSLDGVTIDSAGLQMERLFHVRDRGSGQRERPEFSRPCVVWGICGAAALYRVSMLVDVSLFDRPFDETFFVYKEDVDLCWRAKRRNWSFLYDPSACAVHIRRWTAQDRVSNRAVAHSFANQVALVMRHAPTFSWLVIISMAVELLRLLLIFVRRPKAALLTVKLIVSQGTYHWQCRRTLQNLDLVKVSRRHDLCHPGYI